MSPVARVGPRRAIARVGFALFALAAAGFLCFVPFAGRFLVREDPLASADAIFVLAGSRVERWLEGYELYRERRAPLIILSPGPARKAEIDLRAQGVRFPSEGEIARDALLQLGVPAEAIRILPRPVDNTAQEAQALHDISRKQTWQRVIVRHVGLSHAPRALRVQARVQGLFDSDRRARVAVRRLRTRTLVAPPPGHPLRHIRTSEACALWVGIGRMRMSAAHPGVASARQAGVPGDRAVRTERSKRRSACVAQ